MGIEEAMSILGVTSGMSLDDIKRVYRKKSLKNHPDMGGNAEVFNKISKAYNVIKNNYNKLPKVFKYTHGKNIFNIMED